MDFADILDKWEKQTEKAAGKKAGKKAGKEKPSRDSRSDWLGNSEIYDKDAAQLREQNSGENSFRGERRARLLRKKPEIGRAHV